MEQWRSIGLCWDFEKASRALSPAKAHIQRGKPCAERLGNGHVPGIVRGQVSTQLPNAGGEGAVWKQLDAQREEIGMGERRRIRGNLAGKDRPAQDVRRLDWHEMRSRKLTAGKQVERPCTVPAAVDEGGNDKRCVNNEHQRRSASRHARIFAAGSSVPVRSFRSAILARTVSTSGRLARPIS